MRLRRGCGCPLLILLIVNAIFVIAAVLGLIRGPSETPVQGTTLGTVFILAVMLANGVVCAIVAVAALRSQPIGGAPGDHPDEGLDYGDDTAVPDADRLQDDD